MSLSSLCDQPLRASTVPAQQFGQLLAMFAAIRLASSRKSSLIPVNLLPRLADFSLRSLFDFALMIHQMPERGQVSIKRRFSVCGGSLCCPQICDYRFLVSNYTSRFDDTLGGRHQGSVLSGHDGVPMAACGFTAPGIVTI
jgi:hypothetical protein